MNINRSSFYKWINRRSHPSNRELNRIDACRLFEEYHNKFPSHGYRWLNAFIKIELGVVYSDNYAHKICKFLNIKSESKHFIKNLFGSLKTFLILFLLNLIL